MNTTDFGWPMSSPVKTVGSKIFLDAHKRLSPSGYFNEKQCKRILSFDKLTKSPLNFPKIEMKYSKADHLNNSRKITWFNKIDFSFVTFCGA